MKAYYHVALLFLFVSFTARGQQTNNTAGGFFTQGNQVLTFSLGETVNQLFNASDAALKAGVIQSFAVACPVPKAFAFQSLNNLCIPEGGGISLALNSSEPNVRYLLKLNGNAIGDSIIGTGNALNLANASQAGVYTVSASYPGKACFIDMPQQLTLQAAPRVTVTLPTAAICTGQNTSIQLTAAEEVFASVSLSGGTFQRINISNGSVNVPLSNARPGTFLSIASVESVTSGCINIIPTTLPIPVSPNPSITFSQTKIPCAGDLLELNYISSEPLRFTYNQTGAAVQSTITNLSGVISFQGTTADGIISVSNIFSLLSGCQAGTPVAFPFRVDQKPALTTVHSSACSDESFSLSLSSSPNISVSWKAVYNGVTGGAGAGTAVGFLRETLINNGNNPLMVSYELTPSILTNPACKGNPVIAMVTVNPAPQLIIPASIPDVCGGTVIKVPVISTGGEVVKWKRLDNGVLGTGDIQDIAENTGNQVKILRYDLELNACNKVVTKSVSVTILPKPVLNIGQIPALCDAFTDLTKKDITAGSTDGIQLQYFQDANLTMPIADATKVSHGTYFIKGELAGCAASGSISIRSQVKLKLIESQTICPDKKIDLTTYVDIAGSSPGLSLTYWTNADATIPVINTQSVGAGTYYIKGQAASGTCVIIKPLNIKAYLPESIAPPADLSVCSGQVFSFEPTLKDATFKWFRNVNSALGLSANAGTGGIRELLTLRNDEPEVELLYGYSVGVPGCEASVGTFRVKVTKGPSFELADSAMICEAYINLNTLIKSQAPALSFSYFLNDIPVVDISKGIQGTYRIEGADAKGCKTSKGISVRHQLSVPAISPLISCPPLTVDLKAKMTDVFGAAYAISFEDAVNPEKVTAGTYAVRLKPLNGACSIILPAMVQSGQPQLINPVPSVFLCSDEKFSFDPVYASKDITCTWEYQNGKGNGKIEAVWNNQTGGILSDSIRIISRSSICGQSNIEFIRVNIQAAPPQLNILANDICAGKSLVLSVLASPDNASAKFSWKASYGLVQGGLKGRAVNAFGREAIQERLFHEEDTAVTVNYTLQSYIPGTKTCYRAYDSIRIAVLPFGAGPCAATLAGIIKTMNKQFIEGVKVQVSGLSEDKIGITRNDGLYKFSGLDKGGDYTVYPELNKHPLNGVSTYDLLLIQKHILNSKKIENPYELIAADVNKSGNISMLDMLALRKIILGIDKEFKENKSWRFVDANFTFKMDASPYLFPEIVNINDLNGSAEANFIGVKTGDINGNAIANGSGLGGTREQQAYVLQVENKALWAGEIYPLLIYADPVLSAEGMQFTLQYDPKKLHFESALADSTLLSMMGIFEKEGMLTLSWTKTMEAGAMLLSLPFRAIERGEIADMLVIGDRITRAEAYIEERTLPVNISFIEKAGNSLRVLDPYPNPFVDRVNIPYYLPANARVKLQLFDYSGRLVRTQELEGNAGWNKVEVDNLPIGSAWNYELITSDWKIAGRLISGNR